MTPEARWYRDVPMTVKPRRNTEKATMRVYHDCPAEKPGTVLTTVDDVARRLCWSQRPDAHEFEGRTTEEAHRAEAMRLLGVTE